MELMAYGDIEPEDFSEDGVWVFGELSNVHKWALDGAEGIGHCTAWNAFIFLQGNFPQHTEPAEIA